MTGEAERTARPTRYRVRNINLGSLSKFGCLLGVVVSCVPSLLVAAGALFAVRGIRRLLEGWQGVEIRILGQAIPIDVLALLNLGSLLHRAQMMESLSWALFFGLAVLGACLGGLVFLVVGDVAGWVYNLVASVSGGLEVELTEVRDSRGTGKG
jgi:hypothetical protein